MTEPRDHIAEIDRLKGFAILCVVCIHAQLFYGTVFFERIVNRAVPIFLVLFGVTSELWWERATSTGAEPRTLLVRWYRSRFERTLIPFWTIAALWWAAVLGSGSWIVQFLRYPHALATVVGYAPYIGTTWFVTLFVQFVLVYPGLRFIALRLGAAGSLVFAGVIGLLHYWFFWEIVGVGVHLLGSEFVGPGWYFHWIALPRGIVCVTGGLFIARIWGGRISTRVMLSAIALTVLGKFAIDLARLPAEDVFHGPIRMEAVAQFVDIPLVVALLGLFRIAPLPRAIDRFLVWCGLWSWGIYMGHLLVHELVHVVVRVAPEMGSDLDRAKYAVALFLCGAALALIGDRLRRRLPLIGARPQPKPSNAA